jgi:protease PrsW
MNENEGQMGAVRKSLLRSSLITILLLIVFLTLAFIIEGLFRPVFSSDSLLWVGIGMSLCPALIWLFFFYFQDRREPEPKGMVIEIFILGGLLAAAVGIPFLNNVLKLSSWIYYSPLVNILAAILVVGFTQEFLKFSAVRYSIFKSREFDELTDGIIYATAAGLGYGTVLNIDFILTSGGAGLGMAAIRLTLTALAQASFAGITGYFLGKEKMEKKPVWWLTAGVGLASVVNGVFFTLWGNLSTATLVGENALVNPWLGLALAVVIALLVMGVLSYLISRDQLRLTGRKGG